MEMFRIMNRTFFPLALIDGSHHRVGLVLIIATSYWTGMMFWAVLA